MEFIITSAEIQDSFCAENVINLIRIPEQPNTSYSSQVVLSNVSSDCSSTEFSTLSDKCGSKKSIYVCTFCQVFGSSFDEVAGHISANHSSSLLVGTKAEDFVSKLNPIKKQHVNPFHERPQKINSEKATTPVAEPVLRVDGLYWCETCSRSFKTLRQINKHVCLNYEKDVADELDDCYGSDIFTGSPFSSKKQKTFSAKTKIINVDKDTENIDEGTSTVTDWRSDPSYLPIFENETEKKEFQDHVNSIDYTCVDNLFVLEAKKSQKKKKSLLQCNVAYSCTVCDKVLRSLDHIRMHCLTHTNLKLFSCPKCDFRASAKGTLYSHIRIHSGNVFQCPQCDFKTVKRSHLLEHKQTHSSVPQICKLCKNSYKTLKSLVSHVRKYHDTPSGRRFVKVLTSNKISPICCGICKKKFVSQAAFEIHNKQEHVDIVAESAKCIQDCIGSTDLPMLENYSQSENGLIENPLTEIALDDLLLTKEGESIAMYETVFQQPSSIIPSPSVEVNGEVPVVCPSLNNPYTYRSQQTSILEDCQTTLDLLGDCFENSALSSDILVESFGNNPPKNINVSSDISKMDLNYSSKSLMANSGTSNSKQLHLDLTDKQGPNNAEIRLFERCKQTPAYVCCVCNNMYIEISTLKAHLRHHVETSTSIIEPAAEDFESATISDPGLDVCKILQDPLDTGSECDDEFAKLLSSSLDMMYYLPGASIVLEDILNEFSSVPITDNNCETGDLI